MLKTRALEDERIIGYNVNRVMNEKKITKEQLSNLIHIPEMRINAVITGSISVQDEDLTLFANGLGVEKDELLRSVSDEVLYNHNIHYMGTGTYSKNMKQVVDKVDMYVRLLNVQSNN